MIIAISVFFAALLLYSKSALTHQSDSVIISGVVAAIFGGIGLIIVSSLIYGEAHTHSNSLAKVRVGEDYITIRQQKVVDLKEALEHVSSKAIREKKVGVALDQDTPVESLINSLNDSLANVVNAQEFVVEGRFDIEQRKAGPYWFIVAIYGDH